MVVDPVLREMHIASVFRFEFILVPLVGSPLAATQYVIFEARYEVLEMGVSIVQCTNGPDLTAYAGSSARSPIHSRRSLYDFV